MTNYLVDISKTLVPEIQANDQQLPEGWYLVQKVSQNDVYHTERWEVYDRHAGAQFTGCLVHPWFTRYLDDTVKISGRDVVSRNP